MRPRVLPLIVASLTLVVATALLASAEETETSDALSNFAESLRAIVDVEGLDPSDYFQLEVYGDNFRLADRIYYKLDLNPKIDEATREKIADFLYANNIAFALYLQSGDKEVVYIAPSNEISVDKTKFRAIKQAHLDPAFGFPIYERLLGENARQSFPLSGRQNSEDESTPDSLSFRIAARPVAIENDEVKKDVPGLELLKATSRELTLRLNERDLATPLVKDNLDIAMDAFAARVDRDYSNDAYLAALLREFEVLLESKKEYVRAYYYRRASRALRLGAGLDPRGALARQIEKMEEKIRLRAIPYRDEREKVGTNGEITNETSWLNSIFEIKTSKRSYRYGEDVFFKIDFKEGVEL
ncbi:MAG: hypothetical protein IJM30_09615, partial [Thermoguttaceae bacterium]|nr:hypothetical protein [Thermoguttaceae bacterium]